MNILTYFSFSGNLNYSVCCHCQISPNQVSQVTKHIDTCLGLGSRAKLYAFWNISWRKNSLWKFSCSIKIMHSWRWICESTRFVYAVYTIITYKNYLELYFSNLNNGFNPRIVNQTDCKCTTGINLSVINILINMRLLLLMGMHSIKILNDKHIHSTNRNSMQSWICRLIRVTLSYMYDLLLFGFL